MTTGTRPVAMTESIDSRVRNGRRYHCGSRTRLCPDDGHPVPAVRVDVHLARNVRIFLVSVAIAVARDDVFNGV